MDNLCKMLDKYGLDWEWQENLGIPCIAYKQKASDNETVISYNFVVKYRDLAEGELVATHNLEKSFLEFEREYFSQYFFREDTDLKWNYYLLLIVSEEESGDPGICQLEQDDKYLRKLVMTEAELDIYIGHGRNVKDSSGQAISGIDTYADWQRELSEVELEGILAYPYESVKVQNYIEKGSSIRLQGRPVQNWENSTNGTPKFLVEKIETLSLEGFREHCLTGKLEIPLTKVNLISGCNGTGKSSICSALEYAFTGEIADSENEDGEATVTFRNYENTLVNLSSQMKTKKKKELDRLWYGTVTATRNSSLNRNFHTFNYLGLEASGKYMQELDINELVKNVMFGIEVTEAEQKMHRYGKAFADKEKEYRKHLKEISFKIAELQEVAFVKEISGESIADKLQELGYKGDINLNNQEISGFLGGCRKILLENSQYTQMLFFKCDKDETGTDIMEKMKLLDVKRDAYRNLMDSREKARRNLQEAHQKCEDSSLSIRQLYEKTNHVQILIRQGEEREYEFSCKQDFFLLKNEYEKNRNTKNELLEWVDHYQEYIFIEVNGERLDDDIQIEEDRIRNLRDEIDEISKQIELQKRQNDNLDTMVQEIINLAEQYGRLNENAEKCPVCGRKFSSGDNLMRAINSQKQRKVIDDSLLQSLWKWKAEKEEQLILECDAINLLKEERKKASQKRTAIIQLKRIISIDQTKSGEDIQKRVNEYIVELQKYLECNIDKYEYVQKVLETNEFVNYPKDEDWFVYLEKSLQNLKEKKVTSELLLKEQTDKEQELEQEYQKLMEQDIVFSEQEWEECRQKANGIQALKRVWEIDGDIPVLHWIERYNLLTQEVQYAEETYRAQEALKIRREQLATLEEEKRTIEERIQKCQIVCEVIERQKKLEDVMEGFLKENAKQIELFFKLLHRPKEFGALKIKDGKISFIRNSNGKPAASRQMSTGQRMALAFSVMITLHIRAANAPNFLMLDEPVANLDDMHVLNLIDLLRELAINGTQIILTTADSQMAKFLRRKFSFLKDEYSHFELTRKGNAQTLINVIHYRTDRKATEEIQHLY